MVAGRNIAIEAAQNTSSSTSFFEKKESGLLDGDGMGITVGVREQSNDQKNRGTTAAASTVGAISGNVTLVANDVYRQVGSDVIAPRGNITIVAKTVDITEARETSRTETEQKFKQSGITMEVSSPILSALQTAQSLGQAVGNTSDGRMQALGVAAAGFNGYNTYKSMTDAAGDFSPQKAASISVNVSVGTSQSQSNSLSQSDTARGSTAIAGGNLTIAATGGGLASDLTVRGSTLSAAGNVNLSADDEIRLQAARNEASQTTSNSSSSSSVGISYGIGQGSAGWGFSASASKGQGTSNGQDTSYTNTQVKAGNTATLISGGDTNLIGAVVAANTVKATVGGNLKIQSLQDTSTYTSQQSSAGGSISVGGGKVTGGGISAGQSYIDSSYKSVNQTSGVQAGDGGFQISVNKNTNLTGAVIASTQAAVDANKNAFTTGGTLTTSDLQNSAEYKGSGYNVSASMGTGLDADKKTIYQPGGGFGVGSAAGSASSTTTAGISGIAGNTAVRTGDASTGIQKIFDAAKVQNEINAQIAITAAFGQQASKTIGDYAAKQVDEAARLRLRAGGLSAADPERTRLFNDANAIDAKWGDNGTIRLLAHTVVGGLTGGVGGAAGAAAGTLSAPVVANALADAGITGGLATTLTALAGTAAGAIAGGGLAGAGAAFNEITNNYLTPRENLARNKAAAACAASGFTDSGACNTANQLNQLDLRRDKDIAAAVGACTATGGNTEACNSAKSMIDTLKTQGMAELRQLAAELAPSCTAPKDCTQATNWGYNELSGLNRAGNAVWAGAASGSVQATAGPLELAAGGLFTLPRVGLGYALGSGFDAAGQYAVSSYQTGQGTVRIEQSLFAGLTGGIGLPLAAGRNWIFGAATGAGSAGANTSFNNWNYSENTSIYAAGALGGLFGAFGTGVGSWVTNNRSFIPTIPIASNVPRIPISPPIGAPYAPQLGNAASNTLGGVPSFIPLDPGITQQPGGQK